MKGKIAKLTKKLLPKAKKAERERLMNMKKNKESVYK